MLTDEGERGLRPRKKQIRGDIGKETPQGVQVAVVVIHENNR
jgi:hypothetical protein